MDTTIVIEAWTSVISPIGFMWALLVQSIIVGIAIAVGFEFGKKCR